MGSRVWQSGLTNKVRPLEVEEPVMFNDAA